MRLSSLPLIAVAEIWSNRREIILKVCAYEYDVVLIKYKVYIIEDHISFVPVCIHVCVAYTVVLRRFENKTERKLDFRDKQ